MTARKASGWVAFFAVLVLVGFELIETGDVSNGGGDDDRAGRGESTTAREARVLRVIDGDTILVRPIVAGSLRGRTERVRYIGVDTPESVKPNSPVECFGARASAYNKRLVAGKTVRLVPDAESRDRYGRTLAFVYADGVFVNARLIRDGYARTLEIEPNTSRAGYFARLERVAISTSKGLWGYCDR
ncbi:MAG: thermonuclease family protein [Solirubrobacterales bacterium]